MRIEILKLVDAIANKEGTERQFAMRDLLTESIHICEQEGWSFSSLMAGAVDVFKEEKNGERGQYHQPLDRCPLCGSDNICNEDASEDGNIEITCHNCAYQWIEPS